MESMPRSSARRAQTAASRTSPRAASPIPTRRPSSAMRSPYSTARSVAIGLRPKAAIIVNVGQQARADRIRQMFDQVAARYDGRNRLFSADRDLLPEGVPSGRVIVIAFSPEILELARQREPRVEFRLGDVARLNEADG